MKTFVVGLLTLILCTWLTAKFFSWYAPVFPAILIGYIMNWKSGKAFLSGFLAAFLLYVVVSLLIDRSNDHILSTRIGQLFSGIGGTVLILLTGITGGILVGASAAVGASLKHFVHSKR
jgi:hypothetical protein